MAEMAACKCVVNCGDASGAARSRVVIGSDCSRYFYMRERPTPPRSSSSPARRVGLTYLPSILQLLLLI
jgi:hypothetical protein